MKLKYFSLICIAAASLNLPSQPSYAAQPAWSVPTSYMFSYKMLLSLGLTAYYTTMDANKQSASFEDWKIDATTAANIAWRTVLYGGINYWEARVRDLANAKEKGWDAIQNYRISLIKTTASMITYNSRYDEAIVQRLKGFSHNLRPYLGESLGSVIAGATLLLTNIGWFYFVPMSWSPQVTTFYNRHTFNPTDSAARLYQWTNSIALALGAYTLLDLLSQHILISIKLTIGGMLPGAADLGFLKFPDCTSCFGFTNVLGRNGLVGSRLYAFRNAILAFCTPTFSQAPKEEL